jgi:GNAT superfamily N-acetyltransferase
MSLVRDAAVEDLTQLAGLLDEYMEETFQRRWAGRREDLGRDVLGKECHTLVAVDDLELVGFAIWQRAYDVHHCLPGGELLDLYVQKAARGSSFAPELLLATIAAVSKTGGKFLRGNGVSAQGDSLYERFAVTFPGTEFILGGRAFRELGALKGVPLRQAMRAIPPKSANFEP